MTEACANKANHGSCLMLGLMNSCDDSRQKRRKLSCGKYGGGGAREGGGGALI